VYHGFTPLAYRQRGSFPHPLAEHALLRLLKLCLHRNPFKRPTAASVAQAVRAAAVRLQRPAAAPGAGASTAARTYRTRNPTTLQLSDTAEALVRTHAEQQALREACAGGHTPTQRMRMELHSRGDQRSTSRSFKGGSRLTAAMRGSAVSRGGGEPRGSSSSSSRLAQGRSLGERLTDMGPSAANGRPPVAVAVADAAAAQPASWARPSASASDRTGSESHAASEPGPPPSTPTERFEAEADEQKMHVYDSQLELEGRTEGKAQAAAQAAVQTGVTGRAKVAVPQGSLVPAPSVEAPPPLGAGEDAGGVRPLPALTPASAAVAGDEDASTSSGGVRRAGPYDTGAAKDGTGAGVGERGPEGWMQPRDVQAGRRETEHGHHGVDAQARAAAQQQQLRANPDAPGKSGSQSPRAVNPASGGRSARGAVATATEGSRSDGSGSAVSSTDPHGRPTASSSTHQGLPALPRPHAKAPLPVTAAARHVRGVGAMAAATAGGEVVVHQHPA